MRAVSTPEEIADLLKTVRKADKAIGLVPTMGALHEGHFELIKKSQSENDLTVVSIFVNPLQFDKKEDLDNYPRSKDNDLDQLRALDVDFVFIPEETHLYPSAPQVKIDFGRLGEVMEGTFRQGHFDGVGVVVSKLLNIIQPASAYFGMKDLQQYLLIKQMCVDLSFPTLIVGVETVREESGLAMSSRNRRLSPHGLEVACNLYKGLQIIADGLHNEHSSGELIDLAQDFYRSIDGLEIEYLEAFDGQTFTPVKSFDKVNELAVCVAGYVEGVRLIDNLYLRLK